MSHVEFEIKLQIPDAQWESMARRVATPSAQRTRLQAIYFDTAEGLLGQNGVALRLRREGRRWVQTLKVSQPGQMLERLEHNVVRPGMREPALDLQLHEASAAGAALRALWGGDGSQEPLKEIFRTDVQRVSRLHRLKGGSVELALDRGEVRSGHLSWPIQELEIERITGPASGVIDAAAHWIERYGLWIDTRTKSERGHRLWAARMGQAVDPAHPLLGAAVSAQSGLRAVESNPSVQAPEGHAPAQGPAPPAVEAALLAPLLHPLLANASELAGGNGSGEHVHQLRVSIRRLRSVAKLTERWMPAWPEPVLSAVVDAFRVLGQERDREVAQDEFRGPLARAGAPVPDLPVPAQPDGQTDVVSSLRSPELNLAWLWLLRGVMNPTGRVDPDAAVRMINLRLERWSSAIERQGKRFSRLDEPHQHDLRKRVKRLRYALDSCAGLAGLGVLQPRREYTQSLSKVQAVLGAYCDKLTARDLWRRATDTDARAWFAVGWLSAEVERGKSAAQRSLKQLEKVQRRWRGTGEGKET